MPRCIEDGCEVLVTRVAKRCRPHAQALRRETQGPYLHTEEDIERMRQGAEAREARKKGFTLAAWRIIKAEAIRRYEAGEGPTAIGRDLGIATDNVVRLGKHGATSRRRA